MSCTPVQISFTIKKKEGENSTVTLLDTLNFETDIRFCFMVSTHNTSDSKKDEFLVDKFKEPVCIIAKPEPSLIIMLSEPSYGECMERFCRSAVTWCEAPESRSHFGVEEFGAA